MSPDDIIPGLREVVIDVLAAVQWPVLVYFVLINTSYLIFIALAAWDFVHHLRRVEQTGRQERVASEFVPPVTLVVPMYNEAAGIVQSIQSLLSLRYPHHDVVGVDDGSTDETFAVLKEAFDLVEVDREIPRDVPVKAEVLSVHVPRNGRTPLTIIRKSNSGRSDAVNLGINAAAGEPPRLRRRRLDPRPRCPHDRHGALRRRPDAHGRDRWRHPGRERQPCRGRPARRTAHAAPPAASHPGRRVPPCLPHRARGMVTARRPRAHLRSLRRLPPRRPRRGRRSRHREHRRGLRGPHAGAPAPQARGPRLPGEVRR